MRKGSLKARLRARFYASVAAIALAAALAGGPAPVRAQQAAAVTIGQSDIGGVVTGPNGPEAGVWVIAETTDLPTKFAKLGNGSLRACNPSTERSTIFLTCARAMG